MGSYVTRAQQLKEITGKSEFDALFDYIMGRMIKEFLYVEAQLVAPLEELEAVGREVYLSEHYQPSLQELKCVFSFEKEEYFSDIIKTAELVVDDVARLLLNPKGGPTKWDSRERVCFREFFQAFCVHESFTIGTTQEVVLSNTYEALDELELKGRSLSEACVEEMQEFLSREYVKEAIQALAVPKYV